MIEDREIWRAANILLKRFGEDAATEAAQRADEPLERGDRDGSAIWQRILSAIEDLARTKPSGGERMN